MRTSCSLKNKVLSPGIRGAVDRRLGKTSPTRRGDPVSVALPEGLIDLLRKPSPCFIATLMPDGSPQLTETWVTTDGEHVVLNIVGGMQKARNIARAPRGALNDVDPEEIGRFCAIRGRVVSTTTEGGRESIDEISHK